MSRTPPEDVSRDFERGLGVPSDSGEQWRKGDDQFISRSSQIVDTREPGWVCTWTTHLRVCQQPTTQRITCMSLATYGQYTPPPSPDRTF